MRATRLTYSEMNRHAEAIALLEDALKRSREHYAPDSENVLGTMNVLGLAYAACRPGCRGRVVARGGPADSANDKGPEHPRTLETQHNLALALQEAGRWREAVELFEKELTAAKGPVRPRAPPHADHHEGPWLRVHARGPHGRRRGHE